MTRSSPLRQPWWARRPVPICAILGTMLLTALAAASGEAVAEAQEDLRLAQAMKDARVPLKTALAVGAAIGTPVAAEFEIDEGRLECCVVVEKDGHFTEVYVDPKSGAETERQPLDLAADLALARAHAAALAKAGRTLRDLVAAAEAAHPGSPLASVAVVDGAAGLEVELELLDGGKLKDVEMDALKRP